MNAMSMTSMSEDLKALIQHNKGKEQQFFKKDRELKGAQGEQGIGGVECIPESWVGED